MDPLITKQIQGVLENNIFNKIIALNLNIPNPILRAEYEYNYGNSENGFLTTRIKDIFNAGKHNITYIFFLFIQNHDFLYHVILHIFPLNNQFYPILVEFVNHHHNPHFRP